MMAVLQSCAIVIGAVLSLVWIYAAAKLITAAIIRTKKQQKEGDDEDKGQR